MNVDAEIDRFYAVARLKVGDRVSACGRRGTVVRRSGQIWVNRAKPLLVRWDGEIPARAQRWQDVSTAVTYIGPERRQRERRKPLPLNLDPDRRTTERRQEALAGVIVGLTAEGVEALRELYEKYDELGPIAKASMRAKP